MEPPCITWNPLVETKKTYTLEVNDHENDSPLELLMK